MNLLNITHTMAHLFLLSYLNIPELNCGGISPGTKRLGKTVKTLAGSASWNMESQGNKVPRYIKHIRVHKYNVQKKEEAK
jgi:hypothetical protein